MKSEATKLRESELAKTAGQLKVRGASYAMIAEQLGVTKRAAMDLVQVALEEYSADLSEIGGTIVRDATARYEGFMRAHWLKAHGGTEVLEDGTRRRVEVDPEIARLFLRAQRDYMSVLVRLAPKKLEITGASGGPIQTTHVDEMEMARLMRGEFAQPVKTIDMQPVDTATQLEEPEPDELPDVVDAAR